MTIGASEALSVLVSERRLAFFAYASNLPSARGRDSHHNPARIRRIEVLKPVGALIHDAQDETG